MRRQVVVLFALAVAFVRPVPAQVRPRIVNGLVTAQYPTVGALLDSSDVNVASLLCSGTLIGCSTFLTAGHCVEGDLDPQHYSVFLQHAGLFGVAGIALHPSYRFPVGDVAVLTLATPVTGIVPTPINTTAAPAFGSPGTIAGFGRTGGSNTDYGLKRAGAVTTASCTSGISNTSSVCWDFLAPLGPAGTDSSTCNGDSGGPLFVSFGAGDTVAGVTSGGAQADCLPDDLSFDANVFAYRTFIQGIGGTDLGSTSCGVIPQVGAADTTIQAFAGQLSVSAPEGRHAVTVGAGVNRIRVAMNALDNGFADFDLYVKQGSPPTIDDYDCRRDGPSQYAFCEFTGTVAGTWHVLVDRWVGTGAYQATVTTFGVDCANPLNAGAPCDDGRPCTTGDVCQGGTCTGTVVTNGTSCDDGNSCTGPDRCQGGTCTGAALASGTPCDDGHVCTRGDSCQAGTCTPGAGPAAGCKRSTLPGKGSLLLMDDPGNPAHDRLTWRWSAGAATNKSEFGNPAGTTGFGLCVYDERGSSPVLVLERSIAPGAGWLETTAGFKYSDRTLANAGLRSVTLKASPVDGRASIALKAQGPGLGVTGLPLQQQPRARLQLVNDNACWEALYSTSVVNQANEFRAKSD